MNLRTPSILLMCLFISNQPAGAGNPMPGESGIQLAEISLQPKPKEKPRSHYKTRPAPKVLPRKVEQVEIEGYLDKKYVRVVLEVEHQGRIVGNLYDRSGKGIYVHGEYQQGALYVYDDEGNEYNIVVE